MKLAIGTSTLIKRNWKNILPTWIMVFIEGVTLLLFPMLIGIAIDDLMNDSFSGLLKLGGLCGILLIAGSARRYYDTRIYSNIYKNIALEIVQNEHEKKSDASKTTARVNLFTEFIYFLEDSMPGILNEVINLLGALTIIFIISFKVFIVCIIAIIFMLIVYLLSQKYIFRYNHESNNQFEQQASAIKSRNNNNIKNHYNIMTRWRIKLSDLETMNYSIIWIILSAVLLFSVFIISSTPDMSYGKILSSIMYVFGFIQSLLSFPFFYQEIIRLQEIASRLTQK